GFRFAGKREVNVQCRRGGTKAQKQGEKKEVFHNRFHLKGWANREKNAAALRQFATTASVASAYWFKGTWAGLKCTPNSRVARALLYTVLGCPAGSFPFNINEISETLQLSLVSK